MNIRLFLLVMSSVVLVCHASERRHKVEVLSVVNQRNYQEDYFYHGMIDGDDMVNGAEIYAVFDGHGGIFAARFLAQNFHTYFSTVKGASIRERMVTAFKNFDDHMIAYFQEEEKKDAMSYYGRCGSTAVVAFVKDGVAHVIHAGDSGAVLEQEGKVALGTIDHKVSNPNEIVRMQLAGAKSYITGLDDTLKSKIEIPRIEGLAVSRAFGDYQLKNKLKNKCGSSVVTAEPDYASIRLTPENRFLILASDGLWDVLSHDKVVEMIHERKDRDMKNITHSLVATAMNKRSTDNITVMLVDLLS